MSVGATEIVLVRRDSVRALSGAEAALAVDWAVMADPLGAREALGQVAGLADRCSLTNLGTWDGRGVLDEHSAVARVRAALLRGELCAFEVPSVAPITQAELDYLEAQRKKRSAPAPPPTYHPPPAEIPLHRYPVRVIDDTGEPVGGVKLKLEIDGTPRMPVTDDEGLAAAEWFSTSPAKLRILEQAALERMLEPRFCRPRSKSLPSGARVVERCVGSTFAEISAKPDEETTIILGRPATMIAMRLTDQDGEVLARCPYRVELRDGSVRDGVTDDEGVARVAGIEPGDCTISFEPYEDERDWTWVAAVPGNRSIEETGAAAASSVPASSSEVSPDPATHTDAASGIAAEPAILPSEFAVRLVDSSGSPIANALVTVVTAGGRSVKGTTNQNGVLRIPTDGDAPCTVYLPGADKAEWAVST